MKTESYRQHFAQLFCLYRSRSRLLSLEQLGDALAELGLALESSTFSHWQRGVRTPQDRNTLLKLIKALYLNQGIRNEAEANQLLTACQQGVVTKLEWQYVTSATTMMIPREKNRLSSRDQLAELPEANTLSIVFNMILPAKLDAYLAVQAKIKQVSKAAIIRQILDREMKNSTF